MKNREVNLLELIPRRNREWEKDDDSHIVILAPRFTSRLMMKVVVPRLKRPHYKVNLDDVGSWIWLHCDGVMTVEEIGKGLVEKYGEQVQPVFDRLGSFFRIMEEHLFITFKNLS